MATSSASTGSSTRCRSASTRRTSRSSSRLPGASPARRVGEPVSLLDLLPTLADLARPGSLGRARAAGRRPQPRAAARRRRRVRRRHGRRRVPGRERARTDGHDPPRALEVHPHDRATPTSSSTSRATRSSSSTSPTRPSTTRCRPRLPSRGRRALGSRGDRPRRTREPACATRGLPRAPAGRDAIRGTSSRRAPPRSSTRGTRWTSRSATSSPAFLRPRREGRGLQGVRRAARDRGPVLDPPQEGEVLVRVARLRDLPQRHPLRRRRMGRHLACRLRPRGGGRRRGGRRRRRRCAPGDRVVVSLLRSCGRCFFCARGEAHLCEARVPDRPREQAHATPTASRCPRPAHRRLRRAGRRRPSQLAVVPDFLPSTSPRCSAAASITGIRRGRLPRPRCPPARACSSSERAESGSTACRVQHLRRRQPIVAVDLSPAEARERRSPSAPPIPSIRRHAIPWRRCARSRVGAAPTTSSSRSARGQAVEQGLGASGAAGRSSSSGMPPSDASFRVVAVDLAYNDAAHPRQQHGLRPSRDRCARPRRALRAGPV